jgi:ketosteroid isomerase-like protein
VPTKNEATIAGAYAAFGSGDMDVIRNESFAKDIKWTWPGNGPLSGVYSDVEGVIGMFGKLFEGSGGTFKVSPDSITGFGDFVVVCSSAAWTDKAGAHVDPYVQTFRFKDGKASECCIHFNDIALWDAFPA